VQYDLIDLRLFVHVVAEGSITAGARRMHLALPSASARVRAMEQHAGVPLLVRGRRGVAPTPAGTALARHARDVLAQVARLDGAVAGYLRTPAAPVTLLAGSSALHRLVPRALTSFLREHPDRDVTVLQSRSAQTVRMLVDGQADLGIVIEDETRDSGLETEPLGDDSLVVIGQPDGILGGRTAMRYAEVAEHPMVGLDVDSPLQRWIDGNLGPHAPQARFRTRVGHLGSVVALAAAGVGLAVVPRRAAEPDPAASAPVQLCALQEHWSRRQLALCFGAAVPQSATAVLAIAEHIRRAAFSTDRLTTLEPPF
jgi:DNA-binding transcriptional LysR family regulator